ncbi:hypothetical protein AB0F16_40655, partial [Streptomyces tanashiensis]
RATCGSSVGSGAARVSARSSSVVPRNADVAAVAETAPGPSRAGSPGKPGKQEKPGRAARAARPGRRPRRERHTSPGSWFVLLCVAGVLGAWLYSLFGGYPY